MPFCFLPRDLRVAFYAAFAVAALLVSSLSHAASSAVSSRFALGEPTIVITHRGNGFGFPENSLAGVEAAIKAGVEVIEVDVRVSADRTHFIMHDATLSRTTDVDQVYPDGPPPAPGFEGFAMEESAVSYFKAEELERLSLKSADGKRYPVPTLEEILAAAKGKAIVDLDIKTFDPDGLKQIVDEFGQENLIVRNPNLSKLQQIYAATGASPLCSLDSAKDKIARLHQIKDTFGEDARAVEVDYSSITPDLIKEARSLGIRLWVNGHELPDIKMGQHDDTLWRKVISSGATAYLSNYPVEIKKLLDERQ
nr:glycerophosphodiester phosphodiesterase family protein [uncultured Cohaesibacter sp.]